MISTSSGPLVIGLVPYNGCNIIHPTIYADVIGDPAQRAIFKLVSSVMYVVLKIKSSGSVS